MSVIDKLATSLNRRDEGPNLELAQHIANKGDKRAVKELVDNLTNKDKNIQSDCIKILYEIGERNPRLIADYSKEFVALLGSENNRLVWGAITALDTITLENPKEIYLALSKIIAIVDKGSVITKDHGVNILIKLASIKKFGDRPFNLLIEQLKSCPTNQLPMYAEKTMRLINDGNKTVFIRALASRLDSVKKETKRNRLEKMIKKLS